MTTELLLFGFALAPALVVLWRIRTVPGEVLVISKKRALFVIALMSPVLFISSFLSPLVVALTLSLMLRPVKVGAGRLHEESETMLANLSRIQGELQATGLHLEHLSTSIQTARAEIESKEKQKLTLQNDIDRHLRDAEAWQELSQEHRELFVSAASEAMRRRSFLQVVAVIAGSILLNILASSIWAVLGTLGRAQLLQFLEQLKP